MRANESFSVASDRNRNTERTLVAHELALVSSHEFYRLRCLIEVFVFAYDVSVSYSYTFIYSSRSPKIRAEDDTACSPADLFDEEIMKDRVKLDSRRLLVSTLSRSQL